MKKLITLMALAAVLSANADTPLTTADTVVVVDEYVDTEYTVTAETVTAPKQNFLKQLHYKAEAMASVSSNRTPFWLLNNRWGLSSLSRRNGYLRAGLFRDMDHKDRFSWGFGADIVWPVHFTSRFVIQQLYGEVRYRSLQLTVGSKERYIGVVNEELGSGDMTFSQNARPVPQVFLSMPEYEWVPYARHWLAVKGFFSIGMQTDWRWQRDHVGPKGRWAEHVMFNTKGLFLRVGDPERHQFTVEGGLEMGTQFGGKVHYFDENDNKFKTIKMPTDFKNIVKATLGVSGGDSNDPNQAGEISNAYGNTVGEWSAAVTYRPRGTEWAFRTYYQHYFDDHSMLFFNHKWRDMLLGVEITFPKNRIIDQFVYEYLMTKDQSGPVYWDHTPDIPEQVSGRDNYYNHYIYSGWQHWGMGLGNPLLISPIYNADNSLFFYHNRIKGHHFGFKGSPTDELHYRVLISATRSWGSYEKPTRDILHNFNALLEVTYSPRRISGLDFRLGLACDAGKLLGKSYGAMLTIKKTGWL